MLGKRMEYLVEQWDSERVTKEDVVELVAMDKIFNFTSKFGNRIQGQKPKMVDKLTELADDRLHHLRLMEDVAERPRQSTHHRR